MKVEKKIIKFSMRTGRVKESRSTISGARGKINQSIGHVLEKLPGLKISISINFSSSVFLIMVFVLSSTRMNRILPVITIVLLATLALPRV